MTCTKCGCSDVRLSSHTKWMDPIRLSFGQRALRCRTCLARFYARPEPALVAADHSTRSRKAGGRGGRNRRRWVVEAMIFVVLLLLFWSFLKFLTHEHSGSPDAGNIPSTGWGYV
jgi:hypothetical protein